jgi:hypothetical protein
MFDKSANNIPSGSASLTVGALLVVQQQPSYCSQKEVAHHTNTYVKDVKAALVSVSMHMRTESHKQHTELRHNAQVVALPAKVSYCYGIVQ